VRPEDIRERAYYTRRDTPRYFRRVEFIIDAPHRAGGKMVAWSTDAFGVIKGRRYGRCSIETFARWAHEEMNV
jgi:hypothetical protein